MAFNELINRLIPEGAVLPGSRPKTILADDGSGGGEPGYHDTTAMGNMARALQAFQASEQIKQEEKIAKMKKRSDMYKTLRDSGYTPKKAYEAVNKMEFPDEEGDESVKEKENVANVDKIKAQTETEKARGRNIDKRTELLTKSKSTLHQEIQQKVADGDELTPGEQKIYDDVIKKERKRSDLEEVLGEKAEKKTKGDELVPMLDPLGRKKLVPKGNVEKAKAKGWKLR